MTHSDSYGDYSSHRRRRSRGRTIVWVVAALAVTAGIGYWGYSTLVADEVSDPQVVAATVEFEKFFDAWEAGDVRRAGRLTNTPDKAESLIKSVMTNLEPSKTEISAGTGERRAEGEVEIPFTVKMAVPRAGDYAWDSKAKAVGSGDKWKIEFHTEMVHPEMVPGQTLALESRDRAAILDKNGEELQSASLVGLVDARTGKGVSGLEAFYDEQLTGGSGLSRSVVVVDRQSGHVVKKLTGTGPSQGKPVRTTIDPLVQGAAAEALTGVKKNAAIVAIDPSNGQILAAANMPSGMNRALEGRYPPGSTFKVVTAAALLKQGMKPSDRADCPKFATVNGQRFENQDQFVLPAGSTFRDNFAHSCNTFFVNSSAKLSGSTLHDTAEAFGIGGTWDVGTTTYDGSVPVAGSANDKAASTIGQARVQASPLVMASIAATVKEGVFKQPSLVPAAVKKRYEAPARLDAGVVDALRGMMRATVTDGAGRALRDLPGEPHAKTGTAEFGTETPPRTHAWMIGYQGDRNLAWSVLLEDGGSGGSDAGPIAAKFLKNLIG
ncbi:penicillin-binding transpeptidase domain-containing protein [Streptomyces sp. AK02-01A]|uniref:penicillin-binding transpeptidase domain-containing protein n=1 Tax=Streptomyces sp. AK02-01A TaxID=3028648 RepID=UPI0029A382AF|nr:penicillin-binding transpeptidase domain-containing protein [Streptomyces sp. AK02-01A]MDX3853445.1 penicillin-binding transpeptidase domain-containing protein [Streptomyces sp. AK02-01A]